MIAALFVRTNGVYFGLPGIGPWDESRDARLYDGPFPVVAHPPCSRWGRYWSGGPMLANTAGRKQLGDDGGCFEAALSAVRKFGGVLEHPEASKAWDWFGLKHPPRSGGWIVADTLGGRTCCVEQGHYGHAARKATWLYAFNADLPELIWGKSEVRGKFDLGYHCAEERRRAVRTGVTQRLSHKQRETTPVPFRDLLISIARSVEKRCKP